MEVVAGSMSQRSSLLDFTLAGDLVTQQVVRVQIETNAAFLCSTHPQRSTQEHDCSFIVEQNPVLIYCVQMVKVLGCWAQPTSLTWWMCVRDLM